MPFYLTQPYALVALLLLLVLPRRGHYGLRFLALSLLIVALAQPALLGRSRSISILVDVSESVGDEALRVLERFDFSALAERPELFYFAGETSRSLEARHGALEPGRTDIARALQVASADNPGRLLLLSDGIESAGNALLALPDIAVDTLIVPSRPNARLVGLLAPDEANPGETIEVVAVVESDIATTMTVTLSANGTPLTPVQLEVAAGRTPVRFTLPVGSSGDIDLLGALEVAFEQPRSDDSARRSIRVTEAEAVLVLSDPATAQLLRTQGFSVREGNPVDIRNPLNYSAIILREDATAFTPAQLLLLRQYVENGGGLMMTGGPHSFGLGAWHRTPVEAVLPVNSDLRTDVTMPLVAMIMVLDRSQSMTAGRPTRISLAKEGAIGVVELAYSEDLLGLITFSSNHEWVFRLQAATDENKQTMLRAILNIETQGGTIVAPAYEEAIRTLMATEAALRHIVILSDGEFFDGRGPFSSGTPPNFELIARTALMQGITTTTISIGEADPAQMERIAQAGGGRFYTTLDVSTLPQIFATEALTATRSLLREGRVTTIARPHPLMNVANPPPLRAYIATSLKADAELLLEGLDNEPILAVSRQGLGRTAALTTDLNAWAGDFGRWPELSGTLGTVVRWLQVRPAEYAATTTPLGNSVRLVVDAVRDGEYINGEALSVRHGDTVQALEQTAPGRYEALLEVTDADTPLLVLRGSDSGGSEIVARANADIPSGEFNRSSADALMYEIARRSGGDILEAPGLYAPLTRSEPTPVWPPFALAGLGLFMAELVVRRFWGGTRV